MPAEKTLPQKEKKDPVLTALRVSEKKYRTIFENSGVATILIEKDAKISASNTKFLQLVGFSQKELEGKKKWTEFVAPEMVDKITGFLAGCRTATEQVPEPCRVLLTDRKKQNHNVIMNAAPIPRTQRFILSFSEITTNSRIENASGEETRMAGVIYNIPEPTFAIDRAGRIIAWNRAIEELTGIPGADVLGKGNREHAIPFFNKRRSMIIDLIYASDPEIEKMGYREIRWTGNTLSAETTMVTADGRSRIIREIASPVFNLAG